MMDEAESIKYAIRRMRDIALADFARDGSEFNRGKMEALITLVEEINNELKDLRQ